MATRWIVPVRRPARGRPAVDDRRARQPAAPAARPAAAAARPDGRRRRRAGADGDRSRSGAVPAALGGRGRCGSSGRRRRAYGPPRARRRAPPGRSSPPRASRRSARWNAAAPAGWCACCRATRDRGRRLGGGLAGLAAFGALRTDRALQYAADLGAAGAARAAARGGVVRHQRPNRRRVFVAARLRGDTGWTLPRRREALRGRRAARPVPATRRPTRRPSRSSAAAWRSVRADVSPQARPVPRAPAVRGARRRPGDRVAGRPRARPRATTSTSASRRRATSPRRPDALLRQPGRVDRVAVNGRRFAVHGGWNRLPVGLRGVRVAERADRAVVQPPTGEGGAGGIRELRIPGVRATEALRPPMLVEHALRGADLRRARADVPLRPHHRRRPAAPARRTASAARASCATRRTPSAAGRARRPARGARVAADGWVSVGARDARPRARRAGRRAARPRPSTPPRASRASGATAPRRRSTATRGGPGSAGGSPARRVASWRTRRAADDPHGSARRAPVRVRRPTRVRVIVDGRPTAPLAVAPAAASRCPRRCARRTFRSTSSTPRFPAGTPGSDRSAARSGSGRCAATGVPRAAVRAAAGRCACRCGDGPALHPARSAVRLRAAATARRDRRRPPAARRGLRRAGRAARRAGDAPGRRRAAAPDGVRLTSPARRDHAGRRRRARDRSGARRARRPRRGARRGHRADLARARRDLQRGLERALRRALARQARRRCRATPTPGR